MTPKNPTPVQKENAGFMGWQYLGDGMFSRGDDLGGYTNAGWVYF